MKGYVFTSPINGNFIPQRVQNLAISNYAAKNGIKLLQSIFEYDFPGTFRVLYEDMRNDENHYGYIFFSIQILFIKESVRTKLINQLLKQGELHFALENLSFTRETVNNLCRLLDINKYEEQTKLYEKRLVETCMEDKRTSIGESKLKIVKKEGLFTRYIVEYLSDDKQEIFNSISFYLQLLYGFDINFVIKRVCEDYSAKENCKTPFGLLSLSHKFIDLGELEKSFTGIGLNYKELVLFYTGFSASISADFPEKNSGP